MDLVAELEPLTHVARVRRLVALGRLAAQNDATARASIAALAASSHAYERSLAVMTAWGSGDREIVLAGLVDRSRTVRRRAASLLSRLAEDRDVVEGLSRVRDPRLLVQLVTSLRRRRPGTVDGFLERADRSQPRIGELEPLGSAAFAAHRLDTILDAGPVAWARLAQHHGALLVDRLLRRLDESASTIDPRLRWQLLAVLPRLAHRAPERALEIVARLLARGEDPRTIGGALAELVRRLPVETFDLLRRAHEGARPMPPPGPFALVKLDRVAHRLGAERLAYVVRHAWGTLSDGTRARRWFLRLSVEDREAVLQTWLDEGRGAWGAFLLRHVAADGARAEARERAYRRWSAAARDKDGIIHSAQIGALPADLRAREARRHLHETPMLASRPALRVTFAAFLPFEEAKAALAPWLGHPEGEERGRSARALMQTVEHDRAAMPDALAWAHARRFEQDPVRQAILEALAALPVSRFRAEHLAAVGDVAQDALDAADLSATTSGHLERWIVRLFRVDARWGAAWLTRLLAVRGSITAVGLGDHLNAREVQAFAPVVAELAEAWATRERAGAIVWLASSLARRLSLVDALVDALERLTRELPFVGVAAVSLALLREHARPRFARLVPELVAIDPSFVVLSVVARHLSCKRQDLLTPFLGDAPMTGRFASGRTSWVIDFGAGFGGWTATQQRAHATTLDRVLADEKREVPALRHALDTLGQLAFAPPEVLVRYAADRRPPVREMAVRALPWLDGGDGFATLLESLGDDRARWAIYALRSAFRELDEVAVIEHLARAPTTMVTVAKEIVRLYGELRSDEAYRRLLAFDRADAHRDVRVALLRALWDHLDRAPTWPVFERATADQDWIVAAKLADVPLGRLSKENESRVAALLARVLDRPEAEARLALLGRVAYLPLADGGRALFSKCVALLGSAHPDECHAACAAVLQRMLPDETQGVLKRLGELVPARRTLVAIVARVPLHAGPYAAPHVREVVRGLLAILAEDPFVVCLRLELAGRLLDWKDLAAMLIEVSKRGLLHVDAMTAALAAVASSVHPELVEARLADASDPCLRRLALAALVSAAGPGRGWTPDRRARLGRYQKDAAPLVAGAAAFVFPPA
jgi:hypothetical protein